MKKTINPKERLKVSSKAFMKAVKTKINRPNKQSENASNRNGARLLLQKLDSKLTGMAGPA